MAGSVIAACLLIPFSRIFGETILHLQMGYGAVLGSTFGLFRGGTLTATTVIIGLVAGLIGGYYFTRRGQKPGAIFPVPALVLCLVEVALVLILSQMDWFTPPK